MSYAVSTRSREIGVRIAIGARKIDVVGMVLRQGGMLAGGGTMVGILLSLGADRLMASAFPGNAHPLSIYLMVVPSVFAVTMLAAYIPARRASLVDPVTALRQD
jgi:ABC-type antimicrobial peptide transport system permease subunit